MKKIILMAFAGTLLFAGTASATLCTDVRNLNKSLKTETTRDRAFYQELFPQRDYRGNDRWNGIVLQCNRKRDNHGGKVKKSTGKRGDNAGKRTLKSRNLKAKAIRGKYAFFGKFPPKYVYVVSKKDGV